MQDKKTKTFRAIAESEEGLDRIIKETDGQVVKVQKQRMPEYHMIGGFMATVTVRIK